MTSDIVRSRLLKLSRACAVAAACALGAAAASAHVSSPGAMYDGPAITRVSAYVFMDMQPQYMPDDFQRAFKARLAQELTRSGVPNRQVWFADTRAGRDLIANPKAYTSTSLTSIPIGATIRENLAAEREFRPSHWLLVYPTESEPAGSGVLMTVRWELKDTRTGYVSWSIYSMPHTLYKTLAPATAEEAANDAVDEIVAEMRRCKVLADPKE